MHFQRNIVTGLLTAIPIIVTYFVFDFLLRLLSSTGRPVIGTIAQVLKGISPAVAEIFLNPAVQSILGILLVLFGLYVLGWATSKVIGVRIIAKVDQLMARIPIVQTIYGSTKKLIDSFRTPPVGLQRVVLIDFPHSQMKTVGLVTRTLEDEHTGAKLAVVYVPTAPNPTSGYLEIVPIDKLISTDWTMDDAMTFVVSGGAVAPNEVNFTVSKDPPEITIPPANKKAAAE